MRNGLLLIAVILLLGPRETLAAHPRMRAGPTEQSAPTLLVDDAIMQKATKEQLVGAWEMIPVSPDMNKANPYPLPFQYFAIMADGRIGSMMASKKQEGMTGRILVEALNHAGWDHYEFQTGALILTHAQAPSRKEAWQVLVVTKDAVIRDLPHRKGDIVMVLLNGSDLHPIYFRHLQRLPD